MLKPKVGQEVAVLFDGLTPDTNPNVIFAYRAYVLAVNNESILLHVPRHMVGVIGDDQVHLVKDDGFLPRFCTQPGPDEYLTETVMVDRIHALWADHNRWMHEAVRANRRKQKAERDAAERRG